MTTRLMAGLGTDLQPTALGLASISLVAIAGLARDKMALPLSRVHLLLLLCCLYSFLISFVHDSYSIQSFGNYTSLFVFSLFGFWTVRFGALSISPILVSIGAWLLTGTVQSYIDRQFGLQLLFHSRTTSDRGVASLAAEPSYYGICCLFLLFSMQFFRTHTPSKQRVILITEVLLVFQIILLAKSMFAILGLVVWLFSSFILKPNKSIKFTLGASFLFLIGGGAIVALGGERLNKLMNGFFSNPLSLFKTDASANQRLSDIAGAVYGFLSQLPLAFGYGTNTWVAYQEEIGRISNFFWYGKSYRIMSGYGAAMFELGFVGLVIPITCFVSFWRHDCYRIRAIGISLSIVMFAAVPLALPMFSFLIGISEGATFLNQRSRALAVALSGIGKLDTLAT